MCVITTPSCTIGLLLLVLSTGSIADENDWPIEPVGADHPIGNTLGELMVNQSGNYYQHGGVDILAKPFPDPAATFVVVKVGGAVDWVNMSANGQDNFVRIVSDDGSSKYIYHHLEYSMLSLPLQLHFNNTNPANRNIPEFWPAMKAGDRIAQVHDSFICDLDHLHYEVQRASDGGLITEVNPLSRIEPKPDADAPQIENIFLAKRGQEQWDEFDVDVSAGGCTVVSGNVDIIAEVSDRDGGVSNVGLYDVQWRACKQGEPECDWLDAYRYDDMQGSWTDSNAGVAEKHFSLLSPWISIPEAWLRSENACPVAEEGEGGPASKSFTILTSSSAGGPWKTGSNRYGNGKYVLSVKAADISGNSSAPKSKFVCVRN